MAPPTDAPVGDPNDDFDDDDAVSGDETPSTDAVSPTDAPIAPVPVPTDGPKPTDAPIAPVPVPTDGPKPTDAPIAPVPAPTDGPKPTDAPIPPVPAPTDGPKPTDAPVMSTEPPLEAPTDPPETESPSASPTFSPTEMPDPHADASVTSQSFQSNWGPSYAGAMVYDFTRHSVYLTGATYIKANKKKQSTCFLGHLPISALHKWKTVDDPVRDGEPAEIAEHENLACRSMAHDQDYLWVGGLNEEQGTDRNSPQHGFFTLYERDHKNPDWSIMTAKVVDAVTKHAKIQLPDAMVVDPNTHKVAMAMVTSDVDELTPEYYKFVEDDEEYPNLTAGADFLKRGYGYYGTIQTFKVEDDEDGKQPAHDHDVVLQTDKDVFITGMRLIGQKAVIVGNLNGKHDKLFPTERDARDMDGFAILKRMDHSTLYQPLRLNSIENSEDLVHNVCESPDGDSFFVVGSTMGTMANATTYGERESSEDVSAFISKILFDSMEVAWTTQFYPKKGSSSVEAHAKAEAFGCHVIPHDSSILYAGGVVYDGASMNMNLKSAGSDDIFVAQMDTDDGTVTWMRQIGSSGKENMARNNGVFADMEGDCLLYGDTTGELYRSRHDKSTATDVFFVKLAQENGAFSSTTEMVRRKHTGAGIGVLVLLSCFAFSFYRFWGHYRSMRWQRAYKKDDDFNGGDAVFRDNPSTSNGSNRNFSSGYSDEPENGTMEMHTVPASGSYRDEAAMRPGKSVV